MSFIKRWMDDVYADYVNGLTIEEICIKYKTSPNEVEETINIMSSED